MEELKIRPSQLSTKLTLKLKLSMAICLVLNIFHNVPQSEDIPQYLILPISDDVYPHHASVNY